MVVKPIRNHIIFQFEKEVVRSSTGGRERTQFKDTTNWGFDLGAEEQSYDKSAKDPQWAKVVNVGCEVTDVTVGDRVLIEPLKWTTGIKVEGKTFWRTDETCVLAVDDSAK